MRSVMKALAEAIRWGEPFAIEDDDDDLVLIDGCELSNGDIRPGTVIVL